jgi:hypothetical protein
MCSLIFSCCGNEHAYIIWYSVAGEEKMYGVCKKCVELNCFSKYVIKKTKIQEFGFSLSEQKEGSV